MHFYRRAEHVAANPLSGTIQRKVGTTMALQFKQNARNTRNRCRKGLLIVLSLWLAPVCSAARRQAGIITGTGPIIVNGVATNAVDMVPRTVVTGDDVATTVKPAVLALQSGGRVYLDATSKIRVQNSILEIIKGTVFVSCALEGRLTVIAEDHIVYTEANRRAEIHVGSDGTVTITPGATAPGLDMWGAYPPIDKPEIDRHFAPPANASTFNPFAVETPPGITGSLLIVFLLAILGVFFIGFTLSRPAATHRKALVARGSETDISDPLHDAALRRMAIKTQLRAARVAIHEHEKIYYPKSRFRSSS